MIHGGFWIRFGAVLIDGIILSVVFSIIQFAVLGSLFTLPRIDPGSNPSPQDVLAMFGPVIGMLGLISMLNMVIGACYEGFFVAKTGATPGKMVCGLKVVRPNGQPVSLGRAFGRYFGKWLSYMTLFIGFIMAGIDSEKRALHDMICDTRVMKTT